MTPPMYLYAVVRVVHAPFEKQALPAEDSVFWPSQYIAYRDLIAVVEPLPPTATGALTISQYILDPAWVRARVLRLEQLHTALAGRYALLPAEFGTIFNDHRGIAAFLAAQYDELSAALDQIAGAAEWGVRVCRAVAAACGARVAPTREQTHARARNLRSVELGWAREAEACHAQLRANARAATIHPLAPTPTGRVVVLNAAYIVDRSARVMFETVLATLEQRYASCGMSFEVTGPWPPALRATVQPVNDVLLQG